MIVVDANVLIYAYNTGDERFEPARRWLEDAFSGNEHIGLPWSVMHAFLRITTATRALPSAFSIAEATSIVSDWLEAPTVTVVEPGLSYWPTFRELVQVANVRGKVLTDAHIAALAIENNASVATADRDFARFPGVRVINPLL